MPTTPSGEKVIPFSAIKQLLVTLPAAKLGLMMHDPNIKKDIYCFGEKHPYGILKNITFILVADPKTDDWVLYELNEDYLPIHIRLSKGYTFALSEYNLSKRTFTLTAFKTDSKTKIGVAENVSFEQNSLDWAQEAKQSFSPDLRTSRLTGKCNPKKYRTAAAAYFAINAVGCYLGIAEFATGVGIPVAVLSVYNTYQNCKSALGVLKNIATGEPALGCPSGQDFINNGAACLEGELNAFGGNPYNFLQSCASGVLANAAAVAACFCDDEKEDKLFAHSTGDPHLRTLDQLRYDFMGVGEFVALRSTADPLEIQVRQQDVLGTGTSSLNTGVAVRMGDNVVCALVSPSRLYINGQLQEADFNQLTLSNGTTLSKVEDDLTLTNSQGDVVVIRWLGRVYLLDYLVFLNATRAGKVQGLLGNYDSDPRNDLALANGQPSGSRFEDLYPRFADSWRIEQANSLFVYEPGKFTESYTDRSFPRAKPTLSAQQKQWATELCQQAGVTGGTLPDCVYDLAVTGKQELVQSSLWAQQKADFPPATDLPAGSDLKQFTSVRLEIASTQADPDQINLLDFETGQAFSLKEGSKHASRIDAIAYQYCNVELAVPARIQTCDFSCGTNDTWRVIKSNWSQFNTGSIQYPQAASGSTTIPAGQWNQIQSSQTLLTLLAPLPLNKNDNFLTGVAALMNGDKTCLPTDLQNKFLYAFITQEGKKGVFRVTGTGITAQQRRWFTLDIKIQP